MTATAEMPRKTRTKARRNNPLPLAQGAIVKRLASKTRELVRKALDRMTAESAKRVAAGKPPTGMDTVQRWADMLVESQANVLLLVSQEGGKLAKMRLGMKKSVNFASAPGESNDDDESRRITIGGYDNFLLTAHKAPVDLFLKTVASPTTKRHADRIHRIWDEARTYRDPDTGNGLTAYEMSKRIKAEMPHYSESHARMIAYTDTNWAFNSGARVEYVIMGVKVLEWMTSEDDAVCPFCRSMDGVKVSINDPFWPAGSKFGVEVEKDGVKSVKTMKLPYEILHPPIHPNCFVGETPILAPGKVSALIATYCGHIFDIGLSNGRRISVTPNHMFLTPAGFSCASALRKGYKIFDCSSFEGIFESDPEHNGKPAMIQKVVESLAESSGMTTVRMPVSPEYLHGDAAFMNGHIDVITPDSLLMRDRESFISELGRKVGFDLANTKLSTFAGSGNLLSVLIGLALSTDGGVGARCHSNALFLRELAHGKYANFAGISDGYTSIRKTAMDNRPTNAERNRKREFGFSGSVTCADFINRYIFGAHSGFDAIPSENAAYGCDPITGFISDFGRRFPGKIQLANVAFIRKRDFCGHVYDLQTASSLYLANGVVASNCSCSLLPVITDEIIPVRVAEEKTDPIVRIGSPSVSVLPTKPKLPKKNTQAVRDNIASHTEQMRNLANERAVIINSITGETLEVTEGKSWYSNFRNHDLIPGNIIMHNHPRNTSPSFQDARKMFEDKPKMSIIVARNKSYILKPGKYLDRTHDELNEMRKDYDAKFAVIQREEFIKLVAEKQAGYNYGEPDNVVVERIAKLRAMEYLARKFKFSFSIKG